MSPRSDQIRTRQGDVICPCCRETSLVPAGPIDCPEDECGSMGIAFNCSTCLGSQPQWALWFVPYKGRTQTLWRPVPEDSKSVV